MIAAALLPLCYASIWYACYARTGRQDWRRAALYAATIWGGALALITQALSAIDALAPAPTVGIWCLVGAGALLACLRSHRSPRARKPPRTPLPGSYRLILVAVALVCGLIGLTALTAAPNTSDSLSYHLVRVMHWAQDRSLAMFPTNDTRQIEMPPWAEFAILHLWLLGGSDRLFNLVAYMSMVGSLVGVSLIARQIGANAWGQILAAVFCATIPQGVLQASSTMNDYVEAFWLVCMVAFLLEWLERSRLPAALALGGSLGLALLTKGTAPIYAAPFLVWGALALARGKRTHLWRQAGLVVGIALALNVSYWARNQALFGFPLGNRHEVGELYANHRMGIRLFVSNVVRDLSQHLITPSTRVSDWTYRAIVALHHALGIDPSDPRTTFPHQPFAVNRLSTFEERAGNPLHLLMIGWAAFLCTRAPGLRRSRRLLAYLVADLATFALFCAALRWQPWGARLELPFFVLSSPLCGTALASALPRRVGTGLAAFLLVASLPWVLANSTRPLLGAHSILVTPRLQQYFATRPYLYGPYVAAARVLRQRGCVRVGYVAVEDMWEYPFWVLLRGVRGLRIQALLAENASGALLHRQPFASFHACAIVVIKQKLSEQRQTVPGYVRSWTSARISILTPAGGAPNGSTGA